MKYTFITLSSQEFKKILKNETIHYSYYQTPAGVLKASHCSQGIFFLEFIEAHDVPFSDISSLNKFLMVGTQFQHAVWKHTLSIAVGTTKTYQEIAQELGNSKAYRAVARALSSNKLAYVIPCHRVIGSNGLLTGYRWGIDRKHTLLKAENALIV
jgi:O-6-methylguanine DNA methyltransferase